MLVNIKSSQSQKLRKIHDNGVKNDEYVVDKLEGGTYLRSSPITASKYLCSKCSVCMAMQSFFLKKKTMKRHACK